MAGFVLNEQVEELRYDFSPHGGSGVIPEPSALQIRDFRRYLATAIGDMPEVPEEGLKTTELVKKVAEYLGRDTSEIEAKTLHAIADVCSDNPSYETLDSLPYRHQQAFFGWLVGVLLRPEQPTPATTS